MALLTFLVVCVVLGAALAHSTSLKVMKQSIETDFAALHAKLNELKDKI